MKVLCFIPDLGEGGAERFVVDLANEFSLNKNVDFQLVVLYDKQPTEYLYQFILPDIKVINLKKKPGFDFSVFLEIFTLLQKEKPSVVHTHLSSLNYLLVFSILFTKIRFFHTIHTLAHHEGGRLIRKVRRLFYKSKIKTITISGQADESYIKEFELNNQSFINNGRSVPKFSEEYPVVQSEIQKLKISDPRTLIFVNVAKIKPVKNQELLIKSFNQLEADYPFAKLIIVGGLKEHPKLAKKLKDMANKNISFVGSKKNATDYVHLADAFCLTSHFEGAPISLIEALATRTVPICTPVGGMKDMIQNDINGILADDLSVVAYTTALIKFITSKESIKLQMKESALASFYENYSIGVCAKRYLEVWQKSNIN